MKIRDVWKAIRKRGIKQFKVGQDNTKNLAPQTVFYKVDDQLIIDQNEDHGKKN